MAVNNGDMDVVGLFWNNIRLGQWELASAFLDLVKKEPSKRYEKLLVVLALQPSKYSSGSTVLSTPFHLSWLAVKELMTNNFDDEVNKLPAHILKELELKLSLNRHEKNIPLTVLQELLSYRMHLINQQFGLSHLKKPESFTANSCKLIEDLVMNSDVCGTVLSPSCYENSNISLLNNLSFTKIFGSAIKSHITRIKSCSASENNDMSMMKDVRELYRILSLANSHLDSTDADLVGSLKSIMELHVSSNKLNITDLYSSLMNPWNTKLLCTLDMERRSLRLNSRSANWSPATSAEVFARLCKSNTTEDWELMMLLCKQGRHVLKSVVDGCTDLLIQREYEKVTSILSNSWLKSLTPLVVLLTWAQCSTFNETVTVLKSLLDEEAKTDSFLTPACNKLVYQSELIEWTMKQVGDFLGTEKGVESMLTELFNRLKSSGILCALNETKLISILKFDQIIQLLENQPLLQNNTAQQQKNLNERDIFYSYSILRRLLRLIMCNATGEKTQIGKDSCISDIQLDMNKISSLDMKIELLENIFSLLFLRRSDFKHREHEDIDADNISLDSNLSVNHSTSFDSLSTTDGHFDEHHNQSRSPTKDVFHKIDTFFKTKGEVADLLLQELEDSSSDTIKSSDNATTNTTDTYVMPADIPHGFLVTRCLLKEILLFITNNLLEISSKKKKCNGESISTGSISSHGSIDRRITRISSYVSEAQWRMELVSGLQYDGVSSSTLERSIVNQMLGSSETLVYLTMKKQDLMQAKQVIKMFDLKDKQCCKEVQFMEQLSVNLEMLKTISISSTSVESQLTHSPLDMIRSNASAGRTSSEVIRIAEALLQHSSVMADFHDHHISLVETAICIDLMFSVPLSFSICKSLLDLASLKAECDEEEVGSMPQIISSKLKLMKSFLQFMNNKKHDGKELGCGKATPTDFLTLYVSLSGNVSQELGIFNNVIFHQGKSAFLELEETIDKLNESYKQMEEGNDTEEKHLSKQVTCLLAAFTPDTISKLNNVSSVFDYLKSLFKYVNKLARWQLSHKIKNNYGAERNSAEKDTLNPLVTVSQVGNPFLVFKEDISETFGRLLFDWEMPPKKLEGFAQQASIKLIKIVAERCGVFVGSEKHCRRKGEWLMSFQKQLVLNQCKSDDVTEGKSPNATVEKLLNDVNTIKKKHTNWNIVVSEIAQFLNGSAVELSRIDLKELKTRSQKLTFFINLFNLLFVHGFMVIVDGKTMTSIPFEELSQLLQCSFGRLIFHNHIAYEVGALGVLSALDIYRNVIRCQSASNFFGIHPDAQGTTASALKTYNNIGDCHVLLDFEMLYRISDSSLIQVPIYSRSNVASTEAFLSNSMQGYIKVDDQKGEIWVPDIVFVHRKCFIRLLKTYTDVAKDESERKNDTDKYRDATQELRDVATNFVERNDNIENHTSSSNVDNHDNCYNEISSMLNSMSKLSTSQFCKKLQSALEKSYFIKVENHNWSLSNSKLNPDASYLTSSPCVQKIQTFSLMSEEISSYLKETSLLTGTLIEVCLVKNQLMKQLTTIFHNNILYNSDDDERDKKLSVFATLKDGLNKFTGTTQYPILTRLVAESSKTFKTIMESTEYFEFSLPSSLMINFYSSVQNLLSDKFISTLSPDQWNEITPVLLQCGFYSRHFWKILLTNLELFISTDDSLRETILCHCINEIRDIGATSNSNYTKDFNLKYTLKRLMLLQKPRNMAKHVMDCKHLLPSNDVVHLLKICIEDSSCDDTTGSLLNASLKKCQWYEKVYHLHLHSGDKTFSSWLGVEHAVEDEPERISLFLIRECRYDLIDTWCENFTMPERIYEHYLHMKLKNILEKENVDFLTLQSTLNKISSKAIARKICQYLVTENNDYNRKKIFIIQYMTNVLAEQLNPEERGKLLLNKIGILLIEMIPLEIQSTYQCLEDSPLLIVEQLLMNMKVTLVEKAIACIHLECVHQGDKLLSNLETGCDELIVKYAQLALDLSRLEQSEYSDIPKSDNHVRKRKFSIVSIQSQKAKEKHVPLEPVHPKTWVKDKDVISCMQCRDLFNMFNRRHHCRHCGRVTCATCSPYFFYMPRYKRKERTCVRCYEHNYKDPLMNTSGDSEFDVDVSILHDDMYVFDTPSPYTLTSSDNSSNDEIRASFAYEKAPSASLCLSIVGLRTNHCAAAGLLIKFCKDLSEYIHNNHKKAGIDLIMVVGMIEMILNHAKLKFLKVGDYDGIELTDMYRSQIEVMKILVESKWHEIPTLQELMEPEILRRLRDQLIENEQFKLATEVTTKCTLDSTVNFLMGFSRLKYGDFERARELFARCLSNIQGETTGLIGPNHHYLERIVEEIENSPMLSMNPPTSKGNDTLLMASFVQDHKNSTGDHILDSRRYKEIVFYLKTYGSYGQLIKFFVRNHLYKKAVSFIRKEKCSHELFVKCLLIPAFQDDGCFDLLCNELKANDASHRFWDGYINSACKILEKQGLYHCLYELQLVTKDFYRAALTCVRFYLGSTGELLSTYDQLSLRVLYLVNACKHLENLLKERNSRTSFVSYVGPSFLAEDKINQEIPIKDIKHRLYTIQLQMDVTKFLSSKKPQNEKSKLFTLFGNGKERAELVIQMLTTCCDDAISLASKIIDEFKLPSLSILSHAVSRITRLGKYESVSWMIDKLQNSDLISASEKDEILLQVVKVITANDEVMNANPFIKCIKMDSFKVKAFIACGRLRDAYLEAVKKQRFEDIQEILEQAKKANQRNMVDICEKWLRNFKENSQRAAIG